MTWNMFKPLTSRLRRFGRDTTGSASVEAVLLIPPLVLMIAASAVMFDAFKKRSLAEKAAFTVGDMLSRETEAITPTYINNARELLSVLAEVPKSKVSMRITVVRYDASNDIYRVDWSKERGSHSERLRTRDTRNMHEELPTMVHGERLIIVDSFVDYNWPIELGIADKVFEKTVFTRPRFAPKIVFYNPNA